MDNRDFRWIAGIILLAVFGVLAYGGRATTKAQATQNVLVTNTPSQQVPVLPAARPGPGGAYIVAVNNAPSVKVLSSPTAPVLTKDVNNSDRTGTLLNGSFTLAAGIGGNGTGFISLPAVPTVIDEISLYSLANVAGEFCDYGQVSVTNSGFVLQGIFSFTMPPPYNSSLASYYLQTVHIPVPANGAIVIRTNRSSGFTDQCYVNYSIAYHTVPNP